MFLLDDDLCWSASDLTAAATCEYALLRTLDVKLGWASALDVERDPLEEHIARLGDRHEEKLLEEIRAERDVVEFEHLRAPYRRGQLEDARDTTLAAFETGASVVFQATFFDGEFFGYADFIERADDGWLVCDAKLTRSAKPQALLQLGAYAAQVRALGLPLSSKVSLLLGSGERVDFSVADVVPVFEERRERLRALLATHRSGGEPVAWGDDRYVACGRCAECEHAAEEADDVLLVAGLRMDQRRRFRATGVGTVGELAAATSPPDAMAPATFAKLKAQAGLQWQQSQGGPDAPVVHELTDSAEQTLALLPAPSEGDLFFDFEGDPLYDEGDPKQVGLEYLWGVMDTTGEFDPTWAHSRVEEREALGGFMDRVAALRAEHPDMHVYHYAPYETTALKRLAARYRVCEAELDDLLRNEVFVDLYATVRGSVRVSAPSYSIKKLEPLYMGDQLRAEDGVTAGDASIVAYHEFRALCTDEPEQAENILKDLADYNEYDCLSTLRLRDWLLERAEEAGVRDQIRPRTKAAEPDADAEAEAAETAELFEALDARSGPERRLDRTPEQQSYAMLAAALGYFAREAKQFWWEHFERLQNPVDAWASSRDVFAVEAVELEQDWQVPGTRARNARRVLSLRGDWAPGSRPGSDARVVYSVPSPPKVEGPEGAPYGAGSGAIETQDPDPRVVRLTESRKLGETYADLPVALAPAPPPHAGLITEAIERVAANAASADSLPTSAAIDVLARRTPRMRDGSKLPLGESTGESVLAALLGMDDSYVAIQGPPGTGKTYTGSRVIRELVEQHGWRIGVVAQSHAVVENMLDAVAKAGLDGSLIGKDCEHLDGRPWTEISGGVPGRAVFLEEHAGTGCVLGGTAWTFANGKLIEPGGLDLLVIDEAGQFSLAPTLGAAISAQRLLLLGDPQQLPQVSQGTHPEPVDESALGWLMDGADTIPGEYGYFLRESYRMHPDLCAKVSTLSYDGRLTSATPAAARKMDGVEPGLQVVEIDHSGNRTESPEEARAVVDQIQAHLGVLWSDPEDGSTPRPLAAADFLVVAPYNAQVAMIRRELDAAGLNDVQAGTVDKFQGKQAPVAIVSMTASSHGDVPRGMGFLLNRNRINVAVSRAQWKAILVRSAALTSFMPTSADGVLELGAFIGLCGNKQ